MRRNQSTSRTSPGGRILALLIAPALSCSWILDDHLNPRFGAAHPDDAECRQQQPPDADTRCKTSADCAPPTAVCELPQGACVQCTSESHDACQGQTPVCAADNTCQGCVAHADCSSSACLPSGACGDDTNVAYVSPTGTGTSCTKAAPCIKVADALKTSRPYVKFQGTTDEQLNLNGENVTFLADPGAKLTSTKNGILIKLDGATQLAIYDLEVTGASGPNNSGISLQPGSTATASLTRVKLTTNTGAGLLAASGTATISESEISGNAGGGVVASGANITLSRSTLFGNTAGGVSVTNSTFAISNNFVYRNGNTINASAGGIAVVGSAASSTLEWNTIVDNQAGAGSGNAGGLLCDISGFAVEGNLIFRNTGGATGNAQTFGVCGLGKSYVAAGSGTVDNTPMFVHPNSAPFDYHLTATSPATIVDAGGACTGIDFDGDTRPIGAGCDLGADERKP